MRTDELDFNLPAELIAQSPLPDRASCRLLHYRRVDRSITHRTFSDLPSLLGPNDLLVFNDAKVLPARFVVRKKSGGLCDGLFLSEPSPGRWRVLLRNIGTATDFHFPADPAISIRIEQSIGDGEHEVSLHGWTGPAEALLARVGRMPLPPYIRRDREHDDRDDQDRADYQTVYAAAGGSVAAPTAGLHFTRPLLAELDARGVGRVAVTLHVGIGTFKPVTAEHLDDHAMHTERYEITPAAAAVLNQAAAQKRSVVAVGTTAARVLESHAAGAAWSATSAETSILIRPPYAWKHVGKLITNFHLPRSTLVALVAAMTGLEQQRRIYAEAIAQKYRFFSYGDAMFVE
jgi:S-adenosylmethionine:tRNA ribosyltransferase-isomerase